MPKQFCYANRPFDPKVSNLPKSCNYHYIRERTVILYLPTCSILGQLEAIVFADKDLHEDLISVNPLLDKGFTLTMDADHGQLVNNQSGVTIGVLRQGAKWSVDLDDVAAASATIKDLENHNHL